MKITFTVFGTAEPAGSKRGFVPRRRDGSIVTRPNGSPIVAITDDNPKSRAWKQEVAANASDAMEGIPLFRGPVELVIVYTFARPKSHFGSGKNVTKLTRGTEDALKGIVWVDDSQVAITHQTKCYGRTSKVVVTVTELQEPTEDQPRVDTPVEALFEPLLSGSFA